MRPALTPWFDKEVAVTAVGPARAEREIVFTRSPLVAVALDPHHDVGIANEPGGLGSQDSRRIRSDVELVVVEIDPVPDVDHEVLSRARQGTALDRRRRRRRGLGRRRRSGGGGARGRGQRFGLGVRGASGNGADHEQDGQKAQCAPDGTWDHHRPRCDFREARIRVYITK